MGIFKKFGDLARANLNHLIGHLEDPKKLADLAILELGESKAKAEQLLLSVTQALKSAEAKLASLPEKATSLARKAEDFLRNSDENNAKNMLSQKQQLDHEIKALENEIAENKKAKDALMRGIKAIDDKVSNLKSSSSFKAGHDAVHKEDAFATFARMEEKIEAKEHEVAALQELVEEFEKKDRNEDAKSRSFDKHSDPDALEKELAAMKKKIGE